MKDRLVDCAAIQSDPIQLAGAEVDPAGSGYVGGAASGGADLYYRQPKVPSDNLVLSRNF